MRQHPRTLSLRGSFALSALSGALLFCCFPPLGWWWLAWVALVPWMVSVRMSSCLGTALGSWLGGFVFFGGLLYWLYLFGISVWAIAAALLAAPLVVWGLLARRMDGLAWAPRVLGTATLWCGVEWARGLGRFGFTWGWLGYSQSPSLAMLPVARFLGTLGLSQLIALANASVAEAAVGLLRRSSPAHAVGRGLAGCALVALCLAGGYAWDRKHPPSSGPTMRVAVVQGSTTGPLRAADVNETPTYEEQKKGLDTYVALTAKAARQAPALIIWPESALPGSPDDIPWIASEIEAAARRSGAWLLAGGPHTDNQLHTTNSAYLYSPAGILVTRYDKVQLVPFGEYVPGRKWLPFLNHYHVREEDLAAGPVHKVLQAGTTAVGPMICFESIFPIISWHLANRAAQVLVVITNDAWFGRTAAAVQHQQIAVLRAVETGRWVVRAASTGISSIISPDGKVVAKTGLFQPDFLTADIRLVNAPQPGPRFGPVVGWLLFALAIAFVIAPSAAPRRKAKNRAARPRSRPPEQD